MVQRFLLDTHVLLWMFEGSSEVGAQTQSSLRDPSNTVFVSAATIWEISIKRATGKLRAPEDLVAAVSTFRFEELPISGYHAEQAGGLPLIHRDPFDRMLIAQAQAEGLVLVTNDASVQSYPVSTMSPGT